MESVFVLRVQCGLKLHLLIMQFKKYLSNEQKLASCHQIRHNPGKGLDYSSGCQYVVLRSETLFSEEKGIFLLFSGKSKYIDGLAALFFWAWCFLFRPS